MQRECICKRCAKRYKKIPQPPSSDPCDCSMEEEDVEMRPMCDPTEESWMELVGDCVEMWLKNSPNFYKVQQQKMLKMAKCPFLFGVSENLPKRWLKVLTSHGLLEEGREKNTNEMKESEMEIFEMVEVIFERCLQLVTNKGDLKAILNLINEVEERSMVGGHVDMTFALGEVAKLEMFTSIWAPIKRAFNAEEEKRTQKKKTHDKRKRQAQVAFVYFLKTVHEHIILYGRDGLDKEQFLVEQLAKKRGHEIGTSSKEITEGNKAYKEGKFQVAFELYSAGLKKDPFNASMYGNRAQTSIHLGQYWRTLCDCKRGIAINASISKNYYRAARSYLAMGQLDKAQDMNQQCLEYCMDDKLKNEILTQKHQIEEAKRKAQSAKARYIEDLRAQAIENKLRLKAEPAKKWLGKNGTKNNASVESEESNGSFSYLYHLSEGSSAFHNQQYGKAYEMFCRALKMVTDQGVEEEAKDVILLKYVCGKAGVDSQKYNNILSGLEKFQGIIKETVSFPAAFYGLGNAFICLNRYKEALEPIRTGLDKVKDLSDEDKDCLYLWPQTDRVVEETKPSELERRLREMYQKCLWPPAPNAICVIHLDPEIPRREIYNSDPDYKGHVSVTCFEKCSMDAHASCWKMYRSRLGEKTKDKDMIDTACPTPNCWGVIRTLLIYKPGSDKPVTTLESSKEWTDPAPPAKPRPKHRSQNPEKLKKKAERKRVKKQKKEEARLEKLAAEQPIHIQEDVLDTEPVHIDTEQLVELRKDEEVLLLGKSKKEKKQKKKDKLKGKVLQVDFGFAGDEGKELLGAHSVVDAQGDIVAGSKHNPGLGLLANPINPTKTINPLHNTSGTQFPTGNGLLATPNVYNGMLDQHIEGLYLFFRDLLTNSGPIELEGPEIQEALSKISPESQYKIFQYGGLANFLRARINFLVLEDQYVCVFEDHGKAREIMKAKAAGNKATAGKAAPATTTAATTTSKAGIADMVAARKAQEAKAFSWEQRAKEMELKRKVTETEVVKSRGGKGLNPAAREFKSAILQSEDGNNSTAVGNQEDSVGFPTLQDHQSKKSRQSSETKENSMDEIEEADDDSGFVTVTKKGKKSTMKPSISTSHQRERNDSYKEKVAPVQQQQPASKSYDCLDDFDDDLPTTKLRKTNVEPEICVEDWVNGYSEAGGAGMGIDSIDDGEDASSGLTRPSALGRSLIDSKAESGQSLFSSPAMRHLLGKSSAFELNESSHSARSGSFSARRDSDTASVSSDDLRQSASPASSQTSGSVTGSGGGSQFVAPKPLKATGVTLPTRGKRALKGPRGRGGTIRAGPLGNRAPSSSGSIGSGLNGDEDRDSQTSDRGSEGSDLPKGTDIINRSNDVFENNKATILSSSFGSNSGHTQRLGSLTLSNGLQMDKASPLSANNGSSNHLRDVNTPPSPSPVLTHPPSLLSLPLGDRPDVNKNDPFAGSGLSSIWGNNGNGNDFGNKSSAVPNTLVPPACSSSYVSDNLTSSPFSTSGTQLQQQPALGFKQSMLGKGLGGSSFFPSSPSTNSFDSFSSSLFSPASLASDITSSSFGLTPIGTQPIGTPPIHKQQHQQNQDHNISSSKFSQFFGNFSPTESGQPSSSPVSTAAAAFAFSPHSAQPNNSFDDSPFSFGKDTADIFSSKDPNSLFGKNPFSSSVDMYSKFDKSKFDRGDNSISGQVSTTSGTANEDNTTSATNNTFPSAYDDFTPGVFLPNDLLSASSSNTSFLSSLHQKAVSAGTQEKSSSSYYSLSPVSSKSTSGNPSAQISDKPGMPSLTSPGSLSATSPTFQTSATAATPLQDKHQDTPSSSPCAAEGEDVACQTDVDVGDVKDTMTTLTLEGIEWMEAEAVRLRNLVEDTQRQKEEALLTNTRLQDTISLLEAQLASVAAAAEVKAQADGELERERTRAKMAEAQTLGARHQLIALKMDWALREGGRNFGHLNNILTHLKAKGQPLSPELVKKAGEWEDFITSCQRKKMEIGASYKAQLEELEAGKRIDELGPISVNPPPMPSPPDMVKIDHQGAGDEVSDRSQDNKPKGPLMRPPGLPLRGPSRPILPMPMTRAPLRLPRGPAVGPARVAGASSPTAASRQQPTFEKLVVCVQQRFNNYTKQDVLKVVEDLRKSSGGSLAGIDFSDLVNRVIDKIQEKDVTEKTDRQGARGDFSASGQSWMTAVDLSDNTCTICTEDIVTDSKVLECGHTFHGACIKQWFNEQRSCPNCRVYSLLPEEFPTLR